MGSVVPNFANESVVIGSAPFRDSEAPNFNYAGLYSSMRTFRDAKDSTGGIWATIVEFDGSTRLDEADIRKIIFATKDLQGLAEILPAFKTTIDRHARELGLNPDPQLLKTVNPIIPQVRDAACKPYLRARRQLLHTAHLMTAFHPFRP